LNWIRLFLSSVDTFRYFRNRFIYLHKLLAQLNAAMTVTLDQEDVDDSDYVEGDSSQDGHDSLASNEASDHEVQVVAGPVLDEHMGADDNSVSSDEVQVIAGPIGRPMIAENVAGPVLDERMRADDNSVSSDEVQVIAGPIGRLMIAENVGAGCEEEVHVIQAPDPFMHYREDCTIHAFSYHRKVGNMASCMGCRCSLCYGTVAACDAWREHCHRTYKHLREHCQTHPFSVEPHDGNIAHCARCVCSRCDVVMAGCQCRGFAA
jgi:hypothetical protein